MKTKTTYPKKTKRAKAFLITGLILVQGSLMAVEGLGASGDSEYIYNYTEAPAFLNAENAYYYLNETGLETEFEIEDWMSNIHSEYLSAKWDEEEMELEEWMCNPQHVFWQEQNENKERELAIEKWMTNPNEWLQKPNCLSLNTK